MIRIIRCEDGSHEVWGTGTDGLPMRAELLPPRPARKLPIVIAVREMRTEFSVETLEGTMEGKKGDFLITGVKGEMYPCDRDVFMATYELIDRRE